MRTAAGDYSPVMGPPWQGKGRRSRRQHPISLATLTDRPRVGYAGLRFASLDLVALTALMELTDGVAEVVVGLVDGPVAMSHPHLVAPMREAPGRLASCTRAESVACRHGTFVAGLLGADRSSPAAAICPGCTLMLHPIFLDADSGGDPAPSASPQHLADAIVSCVDAGAHILNVSATLVAPESRGERELRAALDHAGGRGVVTVVAAGNQGAISGSVLTQHPWAIPVAACDGRGRPIPQSNLGGSIGRRGLLAPGQAVVSLGVDDALAIMGGTSAAAPFVTGTLALLRSLFPQASTAEVKLAVTSSQRRRPTLVPPVLNAQAAYEAMLASHRR